MSDRVCRPEESVVRVIRVHVDHRRIRGVIDNE